MENLYTPLIRNVLKNGDIEIHDANGDHIATMVRRSQYGMAVLDIITACNEHDKFIVQVQALRDELRLPESASAMEFDPIALTESSTAQELAERYAVLEAQCAKLTTSLKQSDAVIGDLVEAAKCALTAISHQLKGETVHWTPVRTELLAAVIAARGTL